MTATILTTLRDWIAPPAATSADRAAAELARFSDRDLAELGLMRCDIPRIAAETDICRAA